VTKRNQRDPEDPADSNHEENSQQMHAEKAADLADAAADSEEEADHAEDLADHAEEKFFEKNS